jgi:hypothetical protein
VAEGISGPMVDGLLVTESKSLCVRREVRERVSNGPDESVEASNVVSISCVSRSRYGFVVLMKVTGTY